MELTGQLSAGGFNGGAGLGIPLAPFRLLQRAMTAAPLAFMATLGVMLFRPPDLEFYHLDRVAFGALLLLVALRALALRQPLWFVRPVTWPMFGLFVMSLMGVLAEPYVPEQWSVFAAKWVVPFALYHVAEMVFQDDASLRQFETFCLIVLGYLCVIAVAFLAGARPLIFPRYILDPSLGIHADRARGPFLQAVANGVTLIMLGLVALNAYRRGRLRGVAAVFFLIALPLAVLATKTRAVWLSFAGAVAFLFLSSGNLRVRRACLRVAALGMVGLLGAVSFQGSREALLERAEERSPVDFRISLYRAGWNMFLERPFLGWGTHSMEAELARRMDDFRQESFVFHNSYLEVVVEHGLMGLALYMWVLFDLFRAGRVAHVGRVQALRLGFIDIHFRALWPVLVAVYAVNACFVVMNYQFVNGLLFAVAGMLSAWSRMAAGERQAC